MDRSLCALSVRFTGTTANVSLKMQVSSALGNAPLQQHGNIGIKRSVSHGPPSSIG